MQRNRLKRAQARRKTASPRALVCGVLLIACILTGCGVGYDPPIAGCTTAVGGTPTWSEEFNGTSINSAVWQYDVHSQTDPGNPWGNNEEQYYSGASDDNAYIENGMLVIEAKQEAMGGQQYTSARLHTHGTQAFQYGRIEACVRQPTNSSGVYDNGIWSALWLLGTNFSGWEHDTLFGGDTEWPASGEIDIMEVSQTSGFGSVQSTVHWDTPNCPAGGAVGGSGGWCYHYGKATPETSAFQNFHVYGLEWSETSMRFYIDTSTILQKDISGSEFDEFRKPFFLLVNLAIGGNLGGNPSPSNYPQKLYVDWIRHYQ